MRRSQTHQNGTGEHRRGVRGLLLLGLVVLLSPMGGCHWDSFLDPSVVGRWEETPTVVPILERIAAIETDEGDLFDFTEVTPDDLKPNVDPRQIGPGDAVTVTIFDLIQPNVPEVIQQIVDQNGFIQVLQLGRIPIAGLTEQEAAQRIRELTQRLVNDPLVSVQLDQGRRQTYSLTGDLPGGNFIIPANDYRLLEALIAAGGVPEQSGPYLFVIRQVALDDEVSPTTNEQVAPPSAPTSPIQQESPPESGDELLDVIDQILGEDPPSPGMAGTALERSRGSAQRTAARQPLTNAPNDTIAPPVDLIDPEPERRPVTTRSAPVPTDGGTRWVFLNGEWVRTAASGAGGEDEDGLDGPLVTQRIIRVPIEPLVNGDARYNIVVRPGDVIRLPPPEAGNIYLAGQISRPGVYTLPLTGRLTLLRAIDSAGGLGPLAIPERVDVTRMVGPDRQATVMLNLRAIAEGTQPDLFMKPDDRVNIGTNFWAAPLAVIRNGFRASYGFGFLLDRNFGNDVFGVPPGQVGAN